MRFRFEDAPAAPRESFVGTPADMIADLHDLAEAGVDELNIEPGAPWVDTAEEWRASFDRFTAEVLPHGPR